MESQKLDNALQLALSVEKETQTEGEESLAGNSLFDGYNRQENTWELIIKYNGDLTDYLTDEIRLEELIDGYGIVTLPQSSIETFTALPQIEYVEKPQQAVPQLMEGLSDACFPPVFSPSFVGGALNGEGIWLGIIDSGIDYTKEVFRREDGSSKIEWILDLEGDRVFSRQEIDESLRQYDVSIQTGEAFAALTRDLTGHGSSVATIASMAAPGSSLVIVRLGQNHPNGFVLTTNLMRAVTYMVKQAQEKRIPVAINISYGNSYGSHDGTSLLERFMDNAAEIGRNVICIGAGNEGANAGHYAGTLNKTPGSRTTVSFAVGRYERNLSLQIWSYPADSFRILLVSPAKTQVLIACDDMHTVSQSVRILESNVNILCGTAKPYQTKKEIYLSFSGVNTYINEGIWQVIFESVDIKNGTFQMYLPAQEARSSATRFLMPDPFATITIPATASKAISVGAYAAGFSSYAPFSGRGLYAGDEEGRETTWQIPKPDLVAPGVGIEIGQDDTRVTVSGTSYATPFVTGAAALLMQWGITKGNDPYLYGEKVKACLQRGAKMLRSEERVPNAMTGWGRLCVFQSIPCIQ